VISVKGCNSDLGKRGIFIQYNVLIQNYKCFGIYSIIHSIKMSENCTM